MASFLLQASLDLGAAVIVAPLSARLGLGSALGYLAALILMGPVLGLAQCGEFGFLLISIARNEGALPIATAQIGQLAIGLSMLLFLGYEAISRRAAARQPELPADQTDEIGAVIIAGIGRFGQVVNRLVRHSGLPTVVLDSDLGMIETMRRFGVKGCFGDPSRLELLEAAGGHSTSAGRRRR